MAHVTLIRPPVLVSAFTSVGGAIPPLGLAYLAGTLRTAGHEVFCVDGAGEAIKRTRRCELDPSFLLRGLGIPEIVDRIPAVTQVIGISCMFSCEWFFV